MPGRGGLIVSTLMPRAYYVAGACQAHVASSGSSRGRNVPANGCLLRLIVGSGSGSLGTWKRLEQFIQDFCSFLGGSTIESATFDTRRVM